MSENRPRNSSACKITILGVLAGSLRVCFRAAVPEPTDLESALVELRALRAERVASEAARQASEAAFRAQVAELTAAVVSFQPTATTFRFPLVCALA